MAPVISVYSDFVSPNGRFILRAAICPAKMRNGRTPYRVDCRNYRFYRSVHMYYQNQPITMTIQSEIFALISTIIENVNFITKSNRNFSIFYNLLQLFYNLYIKFLFKNKFRIFLKRITHLYLLICICWQMNKSNARQIANKSIGNVLQPHSGLALLPLKRTRKSSVLFAFFDGETIAVTSL